MKNTSLLWRHVCSHDVIKSTILDLSSWIWYKITKWRKRIGNYCKLIMECQQVLTLQIMQLKQRERKKKLLPLFVGRSQNEGVSSFSHKNTQATALRPSFLVFYLFWKIEAAFSASIGFTSIYISQPCIRLAHGKFELTNQDSDVK